MTPYASQTSGQNRELIAKAGWRQFISPDTRARNGVPVTGYALDNGAWGAHRREEPWQMDPFQRLIDEHGDGADFVVVPDCVGDRDETMRMTAEWIPMLAGLSLYAAVQDGMTWADIHPISSNLSGIFVGGSTEWKLDTMGAWCAAAHAKGLSVHVGRVNTARRIRLCFDARVDSFDGSGVSRFARMTLPRLVAEMQQVRMFG